MKASRDVCDDRLGGSLVSIRPPGPRTRTRAKLNFSHPVRPVTALMELVRARLALSLIVLPANLTVLTKKNNGVFPFEAVYEVIDGRKEVTAHGTREMPVWGRRYMEEALIERLSPEALRVSSPRVELYLRCRCHRANPHPLSHRLSKPYTGKIRSPP